MTNSARSTGKQLALSSLYAYIFCMLTSNALTSMPIFGGAMYMCASASQEFFSARQSRTIPSLAFRRLRYALMGLTLLFSLLLVVIYPIAQDFPQMWLMFAVVLAMVIPESLCMRLQHLHKEGKIRRARLWIIAVYGIAAAVMALVLLYNLPLHTGLFLLGGYGLCSMLSAWNHERREPVNYSPERTESILSTNAYKTFSRLSSATSMAMEITLVVLYTFLAATAEVLLFSMILATVTTLFFHEASERLLQRREKQHPSDPTLLMLFGLVLWLGGLWLFSRALQQDAQSMTYAYLCLGLCSAGSTLCSVCMQRMDQVMASAAAFTAGDAQGYEQLRIIGRETVQLLSRLLALVLLTVLCFATGRDLPRDLPQLAARFHPLMVIPALLLVIQALLRTLRFPLSSRYIHKLRRFLKLRQEGQENPSLEKQLEAVVIQKHRQPFGTRLLMVILRPFFRHTLKGTESILQDENNPIVFLCNHGEIYGPVSAMLYIPVPVRPWAISEMVIDPMEVAQYVYKWTLSPIRWLGPARWWIARLLGPAAVWMMRQLEAIPVYRNKPRELMTTFRRSVEAMEAGDNLLIFPENPDATDTPGYAHGCMGELFRGFPMLAQVYYNRTGKRCRFLPMYAHKGMRTLSFGTPVLYDPENEPLAERDRIVEETARQMQALYEREEALWQAQNH